MKKIFLKLFPFFCSAVMFFLFHAPNAEAIWANFDPTPKLNSLITDLGIDKSELKNQIKTLNVARRKKQQPQVRIIFDPPSPVPGEKVTATATPLYFMNDTSQLYFTWYLKTEKNKNDGIEEWKRTAMKIYVNNGFDWEGADYGTDDDSDGYNSVMGGNDQQGKNNFCYIHDVNSGNEYRFEECKHLFPDAPNRTTGDDSFDATEEKFWRTDSHDPDTAGTGLADEANVTGLGATQFSWIYTKGDRLGVVVEGVSLEPTQEKDSSFKIMWALPNNKCDMETDSGYPKDSESGPVVSATTHYAPGEGDCPITSILGCDYHTSTMTYYHESIVSTIDNIAWIRTRTTVEVTEILIDLDTNTSVAGYPQETETITTTCDPYPPGYDSDGNATYTFEGMTCTGADEQIEIDPLGNKGAGSSSEINNCLEDNLVDPQEGGSNKEKMEVTLDYSPQFPMNDKSGEKDGDEVNVSASVTNAENSDYLKYSWKIYESDEANPDSWGSEITDEFGLADSQHQGINLNPFKFKLNLDPAPKKYLRVRLELEENVTEYDSRFDESIVPRTGIAEVVIPVSDSSVKMSAYFAIATSATPPALQKNGSAICTSKVEKALCPVAKHQIMAVEVPDNLDNYLWTVNGQPVQPITGVNNGNTDKNIAFFPALDGVGTQYNVVLAATSDDDKTKVNVSRSFVVVDPLVTFDSDYNGDGNFGESLRPVFLGYYKDFDGILSEDYSKTNFLGLAYNVLRIRPVFTGFVPASPGEISWTVDGQTFLQKDDYFIVDGEWIELPEKTAGDIYNVSVSYPYAPDLNAQKALNTYWGVTYANFYEKSIASSAKIRMVDYFSTDVASSQKPSPKILASVYSGLPAYLAFLLRIVLTGFLLLLITRFVFSFSSNQPNLK